MCGNMRNLDAPPNRLHRDLVRLRLGYGLCEPGLMPSCPPQHHLAAHRTKADRDRDHDRRRAEAHDWYKTARWQRLRATHLASEPLCRMCASKGRVTVATVCDHIEPHRGDVTKFWSGPFQSLCKAHHDSTKQSEEARGHVKGCDAAGRPLDAKHPWNR